MISPTSPFAVFAAVLVALATARILIWRFGAPSAAGRFATIDGLRGYLAFLVFLHHSCIWYFYIRTSQFDSPPTNFMANIGRASVSLFFMITGFLFSTKIINDKEKGVDWIKLYVSRVLRLTPLYLFAMLLLFVTVAFMSGFTLAQSPLTLAINALRWIGFSSFGEPDLNGVEGTKLILSGVSWTLAYEWGFYLCLPLLAVVIGAIPSLAVLIIGFAGVLDLVHFHAESRFLAPFLGGITAALLCRHAWFRNVSQKKIVSLVAIAAITGAITLFPTTYARIPLALLSLSFAVIAGGATLLGALTSQLSRMLGELAYSIYLLHGFILFTLFNLVVGKQSARIFTPLEHWFTILLITPVLILVSYTTFRLIEKPAMQYTESVSKWVRQVVLTKRGALEESL
ncbi:acyltransferase family protein [Paraburkholderia silvatlantica]|uniref:Peptidoglycan/LPS O-acetylase OafA/YrhL n=1 Tax=Paraburkholderia silvatlantica TaxID=321895 RepID=A0ABR6G091_9BURK|nr:acyltransferase [Paraburkholderia silvatlantica]MBB2932415.1 peptidoglycan/LPS O-acetylase OafA/YrhL [Paraburkholderia silvatlantica]PVY21592.1 peptidoglycan/LPS O-acetylase OafA/YrhL [Paraburkholderia silvatlantica]PXW26901.1 peptidoglycan/LPS O-acetylase OafA/YrhL [Paraburkholderia silvatlantica]